MTYTYVTMEVSEATFKEVWAKMHEAGWDQALEEEDTIDMHGLALTCSPQPSIEERLKQLEADHEKLFQDFLNYRVNHP